MTYLILFILFIVVMKSFFRFNIGSGRNHREPFDSFSKIDNEIQDADFEEMD